MIILSAIYPLSGLVIGYFAWSGPEWVGLAVLLPAVWIAGRNRWEGSAAVLAYYLTGSRSLPDSSGAFFENEHSYLLGIIMWLAAGVLNTAPWAGLWTRTAGPLQLAARIAILLIVLMIPPFGLIAWLHPLLGAASNFPGTRWFGIAAGFLAILLVSILARQSLKWSALIATCILVAQPFIPANTKSFEEWTGIDTQWGRPPEQATKSEYKRLTQIASAAEKAFKNGSRVAILPEQIAGVWNRSSEAYLTARLKDYLQEGRILIVGGSINISGRHLNTAFILSKDNVDHYYARQSVPVSMWRPWAQNSYAPNWLASGIKIIDGKKVLMSMCYEDFLFGLGLLPFIKDQPNIIISMANAWWAGNSNEVQVQRLHITSLGRIFGVPVIRSVNLPDEIQQKSHP